VCERRASGACDAIRVTYREKIVCRANFTFTMLAFHSRSRACVRRARAFLPLFYSSFRNAKLRHLAGTGILRIPADGIGARHRDIAIHVVRYAVVGSRLVGVGIRLGDEGVFHLRGAVREEGAEIAGVVSRVFLLFAVGVADFIVLTYIYI